MNENELFELVRRNYNNVNTEYIKEQVKVALKKPELSKEETINGLVEWIVLAGCTGMNEHYRHFVFSAIGYLQS